MYKYKENVQYSLSLDINSYKEMTINGFTYIVLTLKQNTEHETQEKNTI